MYQGKKVIIVGGSGFIGTQLALELERQGAQVVIVDPYPSPLKTVTYIKSDLHIIPDFEALQNPYVVFNLAGVPIFGRWNKKYKEKINSSRIIPIQNLILKFQNTVYRPEYFVSTSAIGIYGDRGDEVLDENSKTRQDSFLAQVAHKWEQEALLAKQLGVEVRIIRNAHVLGKGGILGVLTKIFKWWIGGSLGSGKQYMSFVSIEECINLYIHAPFLNNQIKNAVSIKPLTNKDFSKLLARVLKVPCLFRIPVWGIGLLYGEFAKEIVTSQRVVSLYNPAQENITDVLEKIIEKK